MDNVPVIGRQLVGGGLRALTSGPLHLHFTSLHTPALCYFCCMICRLLS